VTVMYGQERPFAAFDPSLARAPQATAPATFPNGVTASTVPINLASATLTTVTATIHCASIVLPKQLPVNQLGVIVTTAGTLTGYWLALLNAGLQVIAVSANSAGPAGTGIQNVAVTGLANGSTTPYSGMYYIALGTVSSVAAVVAANPAAASAAAFSGPPVVAGTSATAATTTPPPVGTTLGALTGVASNLFYGQVI